jgi:hypothetical protein
MSQDQSLEAVKVYSSLSHALLNSGGYINLCLADSLNRLALARLSRLVVENPAVAKQVGVYLDEVDCASFSTDGFIQMIRSEPAQKLKLGTDLSKIDKEKAEIQILDALGTDPGSVLENFSNGLAGTTSLIKNVQVALLLERMIQADVLYAVDLKAFVTFLQLGGTLENLDPRDIRPFVSIMKGRQSAFRSKIGNVHTSVTYLRMFVEQYKNPASKDMFSTLALQ